MFSLSVTAQTITIPDPNFKSFLVTHYDTSGDGEIQVSEAEAVTGLMNPSMFSTNSNIADLTGIEYFTNITGLICSFEQLTWLDVSANTALTDLECDNNQLTALDVSANTALTVLACDNNQLTALDVRANTALTGLYCYNNQLTALDVSANTALTVLACDNNQLTALDVRANTALTDLKCYSNQLTALDVSANTALTDLECTNNQLTSLDVRANTALQYLYCYSNQLTALDVGANTALTALSCWSNQLTALDVSANTALQYLWCFSNQLADIPDVTGCASLIEYQCQGNYFNADDCVTISAIEAMGLSTFTYNPQFDGSSIDCSQPTYTITATAGTNGTISPNGDVSVLGGSSQQFTMIPDTGYAVQDVVVDGASVGPVTTYIFTSITGNHTIDAYFGVDHAITIPDPNFKAFLVAHYDTSGDGEIQVSEAQAVTGTMNTPGQYGSPGNIIDLTGIEYFTGITELDCSWEQLTALDVSANTALTTLQCSSNQLTVLDLSANTALQTLSCGSNPLTSLNVSTNTALAYLDCFNNPLTTLDVSSCTSLTDLHCSYNHLAVLDVSANTALQNLYCGDNQLTALDVSSCTSLTDLDCAYNQLTDIPDVTNCTGLNTYYCYGNYFNADDCAAIAAIEAMGLSTFSYNPQAGGYTLDCSGSTTTHTITCSAGADGSIDPSGVQVVYDGSNQIVHMIPAEHYHIADVLVDGSSVGAVTSYTFSNVTADHTISASFAINQLTVTFIAGTGGTLIGDTSQTVAYGANCTAVAASPNTGYHFTGWTGDYTGMDNPLTVTNVTADMTITATFSSYTIAASAGSGGSITPSGDVSVLEGNDQAFTITPGTGYHIADVLVDGVSVGAVSSYTFTNVTADHTILASFAINQYTVTFTAGAGGILIGDTSQTVDYGTDCTAVAASPSTGYRFFGWTGDYTGTDNPLTITGVTSDINVTANFTPLAYTLTMSVGSGSGTVDPPGVTPRLLYGDNVEITATPATGYQFDGWTGDFISNQNPTTVTITGDMSIAANFTHATYTLTADVAEGSGSVNQSGSGTYKYGETPTITATPDDGWVFSYWSGDASGSDNPLTVTMDGDKTIHATFIRKSPNDFSRDGKSDILWHNTTSGGNLIWEMDGATVSTSNSLTGIADTNWDIVGKGDFDADGNLDILWRNNSTGANIIWFMNGISLDHTGNVTPVSNLEWAVRETADFNGDGKADILWRRTTGNGVILWLMDGNTLVQNKQLPGIPSSDWDVHGTGDFDGDGDLDILWRNSGNGGDIIWFMNGAGLGSVANTTPVANLEWAVRGTADFSGDGKADILWRRTTGNGVILWIMDGATLVQNKQLPGIPSSDWDVSQVGDYNGDSHLDILWRNSGTGGNLIWFMNGAGLGSVANTTAVSPTSGWAIR